MAFASLCAFAGVLIGWEWSRLFFKMQSKRNYLTLWIGGGAIFVAILSSFAPLFLPPLFGVLFFVPLIPLFVKESRILPAFGGVYAAFPVAALILFRNDPQYGLWAIIWLFGVVWATDIAAYFTGKSLGGPKLSPRWSPNKTWSGLLGGVAAASLIGSIVAYAIGHTSVLMLAILSGGLAIAAQMGDIFESSLKRRAGVKDSSQIIPGHGGVMDRLDGLITASSLALVIGILRSGIHAAKGILIW
jgi:phosphatidate cytidylyltransferase